MNKPAMTPEEMDAVIAECPPDDLPAYLFAGKLRQLNANGVDIGVTPELLETVLLMINDIYARLVVPPEGKPN